MAAAESQIVELRQKNFETMATKNRLFRLLRVGKAISLWGSRSFFQNSPVQRLCPDSLGTSVWARNGRTPAAACSCVTLRLGRKLPRNLLRKWLGHCCRYEFFGEEVVLHCAIRRQGMTQLLLPSCSESVAYSEEEIIFKNSIIPRCSINQSSFYRPHMGWCKLQSLCNRF